jgi:hypothetical protein
MRLTSATLSYLGKAYTFEEDQRLVKGRRACDCEKSRLIRRESDPQFPILKFGAETQVVAADDCESGDQCGMPRSGYDI